MTNSTLQSQYSWFGFSLENFTFLAESRWSFISFADAPYSRLFLQRQDASGPFRSSACLWSPTLNVCLIVRTPRATVVPRPGWIGGLPSMESYTTRGDDCTSIGRTKNPACQGLIVICCASLRARHELARHGHALSALAHLQLHPRPRPHLMFKCTRGSYNSVVSGELSRPLVGFWSRVIRTDLCAIHDIYTYIHPLSPWSLSGTPKRNDAFFAHPRRVKVTKFAEAELLGPMRSWGLVVEKTLSNVEWSYAFGHYAWLITTRATPSLSVFAVLVTTSVNFLYNSPNRLPGRYYSGT